MDDFKELSKETLEKIRSFGIKSKSVIKNFKRSCRLLEAFLKENNLGMSVANAERFIKKYGEAARRACSQVPENVYPHLFRHSFGAHLYRMGFSLPVIAKLLDHESLETTEIYAHTDAEMINEAFRKVEESLQSQNLLQLKEKKWKLADEETLAKLYGLK